MENNESQETTCFIPVMARLDRLDRVLQLSEEKNGLSRRDFMANLHAAETNNECKTLSSALEEVQHKGTVLERLTLLEKRVLELSLEIDERNTSRSSSSTFRVSETIVTKDSGLAIPKRDDENEVTVTAQATQNPPTIEAQGRASSEDGFPREIADQHKSRQKMKSPKKWLWLFKLGC